MKEPLVNRNGVLTFMSTQNYTYNMCLTQTPTKTNKNIASEQIFYGMERKWSCTNHHHQTPVELAQKTNSNKHLISFWFTSAINSIAQPFFSYLIMKSRSDNLFTNNITNIVILTLPFKETGIFGITFFYRSFTNNILNKQITPNENLQESVLLLTIEHVFVFKQYY